MLYQIGSTRHRLTFSLIEVMFWLIENGMCRAGASRLLVKSRTMPAMQLPPAVHRFRMYHLAQIANRFHSSNRPVS